MEFSSPYTYSGSSFSGHADMVACAEAGETLLGGCSDLVVCVIEGTTTKSLVQDHLDGSSIKLVAKKLRQLPNSTTF